MDLVLGRNNYRDPDTIDVESFASRESEGVLLICKAGEYLYRLKG